MKTKVISIGRKCKLNISFMDKGMFLFIALFIMDKGLSDLRIIQIINSRTLADFLFGPFKVKYTPYKKYECEFYKEYKGNLKIHKFLVLEDYELGFRSRIPFFCDKERVFRLAIFNENISKFELVSIFGFKDKQLLNYKHNPDLLAIVDKALMIDKRLDDLLIRER